jgi:hypothetical protein
MVVDSCGSYILLIRLFFLNDYKKIILKKTKGEKMSLMKFIRMFVVSVKRYDKYGDSKVYQYAKAGTEREKKTTAKLIQLRNKTEYAQKYLIDYIDKEIEKLEHIKIMVNRFRSYDSLNPKFNLHDNILATKGYDDKIDTQMIKGNILDYIKKQ